MEIDFKDFKLTSFRPFTAFEHKISEFLQDWYSPAEFIKVKTSGSTGTPKLISVEKSKMRHSAKLTCDFFNLKAGDRALLCLPVDYISGKMILVRAIERNLKLSYTDSSVNPLKNLEKQVDFCALTPLQTEYSLEKLHLIKNLIIGGAQVSNKLMKSIQNHLNSPQSSSKVYETYGMSETLSHIALRQIAPKEEDFFTVLPSVSVSVDERSCLKISAPKLSSEILQTNDMVELKSESKFRFIGRADFIINSGGLKISPESLEKLVAQKINNPVIFLGIPDEHLGESLVLAIEGEVNTDIKQILSSIEFPTKNHQPKKVIVLPKFPRSATNKILRKELQKLIENKMK